jgi:outer membrane protein assembly factor BamA
MEKLVRRSGFYTAAVTPERIYNDAGHVLDLRVRVEKGPLYHFGELRITGLSPALEQQARGIWKMKPGDPYDYAYFADFFGDFTQFIDVRALRKYDALAHPGKGEHVVDLQLVFEAR